MIADILLKLGSGTPLARAEIEELNAFINGISVIKEQTQHNSDLVNTVFKGTSTITQVSQITNDLGDQIYGRFIAPQTTQIEPTDTDFTGSFMSAFGEDFGAAGSFNVGAVAAGILQAGFNTAGKFVAAAGAFIVDILGTSIIAETYPGVGVIRWISDTTDTIVGKLIGFHSLGLSTTADGVVLAGYAQASGRIGVSALTTGEEDEALGTNFLTFAILRSDGIMSFDLTDASVDTKGAQAVRVLTDTSETDETNDVLYLTTRSKGTPLAGLGTGINYAIEDSAGNDQQSGALTFKWVSPTDGAETAALRAFITESGTLNEYPLLNPRVLQADSARVSISTSGETTVYSEALRANFFAAEGSFAEFGTWVRVDTNVNARTLTARLKTGGTTVTNAISLQGAKVYHVFIHGRTSRGGTDAQDNYLSFKTYNDTDNALGGEPIGYAASAEDDAAAITWALTLQLSGSVDAGFFSGYKAQEIGDE